MARSGEILDGKYVLQRKIGQGGMSEVWMAADIRLGKRWAVKEIRRTGNPARDAVMRRHARAEAELIRDLDHPAIPRITDILEQGERLDIVMDLVSGTALDVICRREGWQSEDRVLDWGIQAADILAYLHGRNPPVLYRDMKPANLILGEDGRIRLVDFGAADRGAVSCAATGTPGYAPPEQMAGGRMDVRSDVYSLGAALRWMLDGTLPGASPRKAGRQFTFGKITRKIFRRDLDGVLNRCTAADPERRWPSSGACRDALIRCRKRRERRKKGAALLLGGQRKLVLAAAAGILLAILAVRIHTRAEYSRLRTLAAASSREDGIRICESLIRKYPARPGGYLTLLDVCIRDGEFSEKESRLILRLCHSGRELWKDSDPDTGELLFELGCAYLTMYSGGDQSFRGRLLMAYPYFRDAADAFGREGDESHRKAAGGLGKLGSFLARYVSGNAEMREPADSDIRELLDACRDCIYSSEEETGGGDGYLRLTMIREMLGLIREFAYGIRNAGVSPEELGELLDRIQEAAESVPAGREAAAALQSEILETAVRVREELLLVYGSER